MAGGAGARGFPGDGRAGAAMASVHESLYFNPMLTNGVVHANVFGVRDWVTPHKMALLVLLSELGRAGAQLGLLERRRLNRLLLPLLQVRGPGWGGGKGDPVVSWPVATCRCPPQGPDMALSRLRKAIEECCPHLAGSVHIRCGERSSGSVRAGRGKSRRGRCVNPLRCLCPL